MKTWILLPASLFVLLSLFANPASGCGFEGLVDFGLTIPVGELAHKDKGLGSVSGCLGVGARYGLGAGVGLCGNFNYWHFGADLLSDSLDGRWQLLSITGGLLLSGGGVGPYIPYLEVGAGKFWPDLKVSTPTVDSTISYRSSLGLYGAFGLKSAVAGGVSYEVVARVYRFTIDEGELTPQYEFFVAPFAEMSGNFYYLTVEAVVVFDIPIRF